MGSTFYYLSIAVACLSIGIFNFSVSGSGSGLQCYNIAKMDLPTFTKYNNSFAGGISSSLYLIDPSDPTLYDIREPVSNLYNLIITVLSIIFLIIMVFSVLLALVINSLSNMLPDDFLNVGKCKKGLAMLCKVIPPLFNLLSWLIMIIIIILWVLIMSNTCEYSTSSAGGLFDPAQFLKSVSTLNLINSAVWILLHYGGSLMREIVYQEPFMYAPVEPGHSFMRTLLLKKLGP